MSDVGMGESRKNAALAFESLFAGAPKECELQEFHCRTAFEATIAAASNPDCAHAALADRGLQRVGPDFLSNHRRRRIRCGELRFEKFLFAERLALLEEHLQIRRD